MYPKMRSRYKVVWVVSALPIECVPEFKTLNDHATAKANSRELPAPVVIHRHAEDDKVIIHDDKKASWSSATMSCQQPNDRLCTALQLDGWQSGRLRTLGKRVFLNRNPGFESLPIRNHFSAQHCPAGMRTLVRLPHAKRDSV
jgi:hypothetical protein